MKEIKVELNKVGTDDFTTSVDIKIEIENEIVNNTSLDILSKSLELGKLFKLDYIGGYYMCIITHIKADSGEIKKFEVSIQDSCPVVGTLEDAENYFKKLKKYIKEIEAWCSENQATETFTKWTFN